MDYFSLKISSGDFPPNCVINFFYLYLMLYAYDARFVIIDFWKNFLRTKPGLTSGGGACTATIDVTERWGELATAAARREPPADLAGSYRPAS
jgi:hypothetical protein